MTAKLDEYRGDEVILKNGVFPVQNKTLISVDSNNHITKSTIQDTLRLKESEKVNPFKAYVDNLASLIPLLLIGFFLLIIAWIVSKAITTQSKKEKGQAVLR